MWLESSSSCTKHYKLLKRFSFQGKRLEAQWAQSAAALLMELPKAQRGYQAAMFDRCDIVCTLLSISFPRCYNSLPFLQYLKQLALGCSSSSSNPKHMALRCSSSPKPVALLCSSSSSINQEHV